MVISMGKILLSYVKKKNEILKIKFIKLIIFLWVVMGTVFDGISQTHPIDESDLGLIGLQCSACNAHIGFLEMDPNSSEFTYLVHSHSITKKENTYICSKCGKAIFNSSPYMSSNQYMKFKIPVNQEALKYEILNLSVNQLNQTTYKINNTNFTDLEQYPSGIVIKLSTIESLLSGLKN